MAAAAGAGADRREPSRGRLRYEPRFYREDGLLERAGRLGGQSAADRVEQATLKLEKRGLTL